MIPYTYDFDYYVGDIYPLILYPKDSNGGPFTLEDRNSLFTVATERGNPNAIVFSIPSQVTASASRIFCQINPELGSLLTGASYVYDIEIRYEKEVYTLLTGTITTQQDVKSN
jgi:hypothetical protein